MKYYVLKCSICGDNLNEENFGIMTLDGGNRREYMCDISKDCKSIEMLVDKLNEFHIEPSHLKAVVEDYIFDCENKN